MGSPTATTTVDNALRKATALTCAVGYGADTTFKGCYACGSSVTGWGTTSCTFSDAGTTAVSPTCATGYYLSVASSALICSSCTDTTGAIKSGSDGSTALVG